MMSVVYVESSSTVHALPANTPAMTALCVSETKQSRRVDSGLRMSIVNGQCGHSFHMVRSHSYAEALEDYAEY